MRHCFAVKLQIFCGHCGNPTFHYHEGETIMTLFLVLGELVLYSFLLYCCCVCECE